MDIDAGFTFPFFCCKIKNKNTQTHKSFSLHFTIKVCVGVTNKTLIKVSHHNIFGCDVTKCKKSVRLDTFARLYGRQIPLLHQHWGGWQLGCKKPMGRERMGKKEGNNTGKQEREAPGEGLCVVAFVCVGRIKHSDWFPDTWHAPGGTWLLDLSAVKMNKRWNRLEMNIHVATPSVLSRRAETEAVRELLCILFELAVSRNGMHTFLKTGELQTVRVCVCVRARGRGGFPL